MTIAAPSKPVTMAIARLPRSASPSTSEARMAANTGRLKWIAVMSAIGRCLAAR